MKTTIRWRVVHPSDVGEPISCSSYVLFQRLVDGREDKILACPVPAWPDVRAGLDGDGVTFDQLPDTMELPRPGSTKTRKKPRR